MVLFIYYTTEQGGDRMSIKKVLALGCTVITTAAVYEVALIGTRALAEDVSFVKACATASRQGDSKKVRKIIRGGK